MGRSTTVSNVRVRYSTKAMRTINIGTAVKTFEVVNKGNVPARASLRARPMDDGKRRSDRPPWMQASATSFKTPGSRALRARAPLRKSNPTISEKQPEDHRNCRNWSDPATFLRGSRGGPHHAESHGPRIVSGDLRSALNFTLPTDAEGVTLEADLAGETIIFPLGPDLLLSWANCNARVNPDHTSVYRCELKAGYRFQQQG